MTTSAESAVEHLRLRFSVLDKFQVFCDQLADFSMKNWIVSDAFISEPGHRSCDLFWNKTKTNKIGLFSVLGKLLFCIPKDLVNAVVCLYFQSIGEQRYFDAYCVSKKSRFILISKN